MNTKSHHPEATYESMDPRKISFQISKNFLAFLIPYLLIALPIISYFAYIFLYGVNVPIGNDDFSALTLVRKFYSATLNFSDIWEIHTGHRMLFPNMLFLLDGSFFHFNLKILMYIGWIFTIISFVFLFLVFYDNDRLFVWKMIPVAYLLFTLSQGGNMLWGFQIAWYLILACLSGMIFLLVKKNDKTWAFFMAAGLGIIASYSSFQGLFLWPTGLVCLLLLNFRLKKVIGWILFFCLTTILYFSGNVTGSFFSLMDTSFSHISHSILMFFVYLGAIFPLTAIPIQLDINKILIILSVIGIFLFLLGLYALVYGISHVSQKEKLIAPISLLIFAMLYQISLAVGRGTVWILGGIGGHYATFSILYLIAIYIIIVQSYSINKNSFIYKILIYSCLAIIVIQVSLASFTGISQGSQIRNAREETGGYIKKYGGRPDLLSKILILNHVTFNSYLNGFEKDIKFAKKFKLSFYTSSYSMPKNLLKKEKLPSENLLPIPHSIANLLNKNNNYSDAWYILSYLHNEKPDLHQAFPITSEKSTESMHELIQWTLIPSNDISDLITPYRSNLMNLDKILSKK